MILKSLNFAPILGVATGFVKRKNFLNKIALIEFSLLCYPLASV